MPKIITAPVSTPRPLAVALNGGTRPATTRPVAESTFEEVRGAREWLKVDGHVTFTLDETGQGGTAHVRIPLASLPADASTVKSVRSAPPWGGVETSVQVVGDSLLVDVPNANTAGWVQAPAHLELNLARNQRVFVTVRPDAPIHADDTAMQAARLKATIARAAQQIASCKQELEQYDAVLARPVPTTQGLEWSKDEFASLTTQLAEARSKTAAREFLTHASPVEVFVMARDVAELSPQVDQFIDLGKRRQAVNDALSVATASGDDGKVSELTARRDELQGEQNRLGEQMRARILGDFTLLSQVDPGPVATLESALARAKEEVSHSEQIVAEDTANRATRVGYDQADARDRIARFSAQRDDAQQRLAALTPSFVELEVPK